MNHDGKPERILSVVIPVYNERRTVLQMIEKVLKLEIVDVYSDGNAFLGHRQGVKLRGVLYRDGSKVAGFTAQRTNTADNLMKACANLDIFAPLFARDISRWLKSPKDGAELGRSWF